MSGIRKSVMLYGVSVIDKSFLCLENASDDFSLCAAFLLNFIYLLIVSPSEECNSRLTSFLINHPASWSCLCLFSRSP
jgi:hypothetical protein